MNTVAHCIYRKTAFYLNVYFFVLVFIFLFSLPAFAEEEEEDTSDEQVEENEIIYPQGGGLYLRGNLATISDEFSYYKAEEGGAIYNDGSIGSIEGNVSYNTALYNGGGVFNNTNATIESINGHFGYNVAETNGGGLYNLGIVYDITGIFFDNSANNGGAIYNNTEAYIENIDSIFDFNSATTNGGAIFNRGEIALIDTIFTDNIAGTSGGAIYNFNGTIGSIQGQFLANEANYGGAITNSTNSTIESIEAVFDGNIANNNGGAIFNTSSITSINSAFSSNTASRGGAIYTSGEIELIESDFTANSALYYGGAIYNSGIIHSIIGTFSDNTASSTASTTSQNRYGGAIYNDGEIYSISGDFINNSSFLGGAIYNTGTIENISASFIGNSANSFSTSINPLGGAIYTSGNLSFLAENTENIFSDNIAQNTYNAIYVADIIDLDFYMLGNGVFVFNDSIDGSHSYNLSIVGEDYTENYFYLNDIASNIDNLIVENASLVLGNYTHANGTTTFGALEFADSSEITFTNSYLQVDMINYSDSAVLKSDNAQLAVDENSLLFLENIGAGSFLITEGFNVASFWEEENILLQTDLLSSSVSTVNNGDYDNYIVDISINESNALMQSSYSSLLKSALLSGDFSEQSANATNRFLYNSTLDSIGDAHTRAGIIYGASAISAVSGASANGKSAMLSAKNTIKQRFNLGSQLASNTMTLVTYNEDGSIKNEYDNVLELANNGRFYAVPQNKERTLWFMPMYTFEKVDGLELGDYTASYMSHILGASMGIDRTKLFNNKDILRYGISGNFGLGRTATSGDFDLINTDFQFYGASVYASIKKSAINLNLDAGYTVNSSEISQDLSIYSMENIETEVQSGIFHASGELCYNFRFGKSNFIPYGGIEFLSLKNKDYTVNESTSGDAIFNISSQRQNIVSLPVGIKLNTNTTINYWKISPEIKIGTIIAQGNLAEDISVSSSNYTDSAGIQSQIMDESTLDLGFGINASKKKITAIVNMNSELSKSRTVISVNAKGEYRL